MEPFNPLRRGIRLAIGASFKGSCKGTIRILSGRFRVAGVLVDFLGP